MVPVVPLDSFFHFSFGTAEKKSSLFFGSEMVTEATDGATGTEG